MSYDQIIYKAAQDAEPLSKWDEDFSLPIGSQKEIKNMFENILGKLKWHDYESGGCWSEGCFTEHGFEISIPSKETNIISMLGCSQSQAIEIAEKLKLSVYDPQTGEQLVL